MKLNPVLRPFIFVLALLLSQLSFGQTISPHFFGQNAWMPDTIGSVVRGGKLHTKWGKVAESGAQIVRFGGIAPDRDKPTNYQYIKMIDSIRAKGMEPIIQVSFHDGDYTAAQAAQLVQYINVTNNRNIVYWSIGNEPDLEYSYTSASQVAAYIKPFASAMKAVDPSIKIIGPETAWYNQSIINGLTTPGGPSDITGTDTAGRYYVDIISFHTYPFSGTQTRSQVIAKLTASPGFDSYLSTLSARVASCNVTHGRTGTNAIKTAVTELNVNYQNASTDNVSGLGVNSFIGGQFVAEMFGLGLKHGVDLMTMWSVVEGNSTALNIGYLDRTTGNKKPLYHHFQMMADHFSGNYISSVSTQTNVKVFSCQTNSLTTILLMNQDSLNNFSYAVRLDNSVITATNALKVNVNAGIGQMYYNVIPNQSSVLLQFNNQGSIVKKVTYTIAQALANLSPTVSIYTPSTIPVALTQPVNNTALVNLSLCSGNSTSLVASSGTNTIKWYSSPTSTSVLGTGSVFSTPTLSTGSGAALVTYYAEASNSTTISARTAIALTVNPRPVISVNSASICAGTVFTLAPSGASSYTFSGGSATVSPNSTTSFSVTGSGSTGCTALVPAVAVVSVIARPQITVNSGMICAGSKFTMTPSGAITYTYSNGSSTVTPSVNSSYSVSGTNAQGCVSASAAVAHVTVNSLPIVTVNSGSICPGATFTLSPSGASTYTFSSGSSTVSPVSGTTYSVSGTSVFGCVSAPAFATVAVNMPVITVNSGSICAGGVFTMIPSGAATYTFSSGSPTVSPIGDTSYTVTGTSAAGCVSSSFAVASVTVYKNPIVTANSGSICQGSTFTIVPAGASTYSLSGSNFVVSPVATSVYTVTGINEYGCSSSALSKIAVHARPVVTVSGGSICKGAFFTLTPTGAMNYTFSSGSPVVSPAATTSYSVWGTNGICKSNAAVAVVVVKTRKECVHYTKTNVVPDLPSGDTVAVSTGSLYGLNTGSATTEPSKTAQENATGITGDSESGAVLSLYPNPNGGQFTIVVGQESIITVITLSGMALRSEKVNAGKTEMNISDLPTGIYLLKVSHEGNNEFIRVLKQ